MIQIIPAILSRKESEFKRDVSRYNFSTSFKEGWVHIDFMDNLFVPNESIKPFVVAKHPIRLKKEAHLMVLHPKDWINDLVKADFKRVFFHLESEDNINECLNLSKDNKLEVGLTLNYQTAIKELVPYADKLDKVLLMSIVAGFQGQTFLPEVYARIKETVSLRAEKNLNFKIGVDGGINDTNVKELVEVGADFLVMGSYLLKGDIDENLEKIWQTLRG